MPLVQERTNYRLDKILTMYDASLGTSGSGAPYSVKEIADTVTLGELVIGWDAHAVERNAADDAWILGGDGTSWRLRNYPSSGLRSKLLAHGRDVSR